MFHGLVRREAIDALFEGEVDILLGYVRDRGRGCEVATLFEEVMMQRHE